MLLGDREMGNGLGGKRYELIGWVWHLDGRNSLAFRNGIYEVMTAGW